MEVVMIMMSFYFTDGHVNINYIDSVNAIAGDVIEDLDIGQNSLSLRAEEGEGFGLIINYLNSVVIDLSYLPENNSDMIDAYYTAEVTLTDFSLIHLL